MTQQETSLTVRLHELCELLHVSTHRPRLTFKIVGAKVSVGDRELDNTQTTAPSWKLMPAEMGAALDREDNAVTRLLQRYAEPFRGARKSTESDDDSPEPRYQIRGLHMVPQTHVEELLTQLSAHHENMRNIVRQWADDTERFHSAIRAKLKNDTLFAAAKKRIPSLSQLLETTSVDFITIPFGLGMSQLRACGAKSFLAQARSRTQDMAEQVARNLVTGPRQELAAALGGLKELIEANGRVSTKSLNPVRAAFEKLERFSFVADTTLLNQINNLRQTLDGITPSEQNAEVSLQNGLLAALRATIVAANDDTKVEEQYREAVLSRRITLRPLPQPA